MFKQLIKKLKNKMIIKKPNQFNSQNKQPNQLNKKKLPMHKQVFNNLQSNYKMKLLEAVPKFNNYVLYQLIKKRKKK